MPNSPTEAKTTTTTTTAADQPPPPPPQECTSADYASYYNYKPADSHTPSVAEGAEKNPYQGSQPETGAGGEAPTGPKKELRDKDGNLIAWDVEQDPNCYCDCAGCGAFMPL